MTAPLDVSAAELRLGVFNAFRGLEGRRVGLVLRGDLPSAAIYLAAIDSGAKPVAILYRPRGRMVESYRNSKRIVGCLGPYDSPFLDVEYFEKEQPLETCVDYAKRSNVESIVTTQGVEGLFAMAKEFKPYRLPRQLFDAFRVAYRSKADASGAGRLSDYAERRGVETRTPFENEKIIEVCSRYGWEILNRPRPYELLRRAFPETDGVGL